MSFKTVKLLFFFFPYLFWNSNNSFAQDSIDIEICDKIINLGDIRSLSYEELDFSSLDRILKDVEIVMLGEQSHGEGTVFRTKYELIFYLHEELGFDLLVFESGFYDCHKAWELMNSGKTVQETFGKSVFSQWSATKEIYPLVAHIDSYIGSCSSLEIKGFDNQITGDLFRDHFVNDLESFLSQITPQVLDSKDWESLKINVELLASYDRKELKKRNPDSDMTFLKSTISKLKECEKSDEVEFWIQALTNLHSLYDDVVFKVEGRDEQMAQNLQWIKDQNPGRKIICWGATSHFLHHSDEVHMSERWVRWLGGNYYKDHKMMGDYVKDLYGSKVYTIGFTAYEGEYGLWRNSTLKTPKNNTLEFLLAQNPNDNFLLPFDGLTFENYSSRPLGNRYMDTDITLVMDAVIFNRIIDRPHFDKEFFVELYPNHKYIKAEENNPK